MSVVKVNAHEEMEPFKEEVRYTTHIKPLFEKRCNACHGPASPGHAEFSKKKEWYTAKNQGPRMDDYTSMISFIGWPDTGAIMRTLDDGKNTKDGKPGNMYQYLGETDTVRQKNLRMFKVWIHNWSLKRWSDSTKDDINQMPLKY
jgi:hypothetical protein